MKVEGPFVCPHSLIQAARLRALSSADTGLSRSRGSKHWSPRPGELRTAGAVSAPWRAGAPLGVWWTWRGPGILLDKVGFEVGHSEATVVFKLNPRGLEWGLFSLALLRAWTRGFCCGALHCGAPAVPPPVHVCCVPSSSLMQHTGEPVSAHRWSGHQRPCSSPCKPLCRQQELGGARPRCPC